MRSGGHVSWDFQNLRELSMDFRSNRSWQFRQCNTVSKETPRHLRHVCRNAFQSMTGGIWRRLRHGCQWVLMPGFSFSVWTSIRTIHFLLRGWIRSGWISNQCGSAQKKALNSLLQIIIMAATVLPWAPESSLLTASNLRDLLGVHDFHNCMMGIWVIISTNNNTSSLWFPWMSQSS